MHRCIGARLPCFVAPPFRAASAPEETPAPWCLAMSAPEGTPTFWCLAACRTASSLQCQRVRMSKIRCDSAPVFDILTLVFPSSACCSMNQAAVARIKRLFPDVPDCQSPHHAAEARCARKLPSVASGDCRLQHCFPSAARTCLQSHGPQGRACRAQSKLRVRASLVGDDS